MAKTTTTKAATPKAATTQAPAAPATPLAAMATTLANAPQAPAAPAKTIALRGGQAVAQVALTGAPYRTGAPHNAQWWATLCGNLAAGPAPVSGLLLTQAQPQGVPAHFIGYALRRGYLKAVA